MTMTKEKWIDYAEKQSGALISNGKLYLPTLLYVGGKGYVKHFLYWDDETNEVEFVREIPKKKSSI